MKKIFLIGRMRTGTKSVLKALTILGYKKDTVLTKPKSKKIDGLISEMDKYDICAVMRDYTINEIRAIEAAYPSSTFVLTEREPDTWYCSWLRYWEAKGGKAQKAHQNKGHYVSEYYQNYNADVKVHFQGREWKVLCFYYGINASWQTICTYFKKAIPPASFPYENRSK